MEKNSKIYVAGNTGLVGSALIRRLKSQGYKWNQDKKKFLYVPPNEWSHSGAKYDGIK